MFFFCLPLNSVLSSNLLVFFVMSYIFTRCTHSVTVCTRRCFLFSLHHIICSLNYNIFSSLFFVQFSITLIRFVLMLLLLLLLPVANENDDADLLPFNLSFSLLSAHGSHYCAVSFSLFLFFTFPSR